jgi:hypothetical protein
LTVSAFAVEDDMERGLLIDGQVIAGTERIIRDPAGWWDPKTRGDQHDLVRRDDEIDILTGHWTAGTAGTKDTEDDGPTVVYRMKQRKSTKRPGQPLKCSVGFVIAADANNAVNSPHGVASIWQTMDVGGEFAGVHVGRGEINRRSIGVEIVSVGFPYTGWGKKKKPFNPRNRPVMDVPLLGRTVTVADFFPAQYEAWLWLADTLSGLEGAGGISIPRQVPAEDGELLRRRFKTRELRRWEGAMEHFHMAGTTKVDAAALLVGKLAEEGWELKSVG